MAEISGTIICFNNEETIGKSIESLKGIVDEILVVDSGSTDATKEICLSHNVTLIEHPFEGYIEQKNFAMSQAKHDLVLHIDSDEALDEDARNSVLKVKQNFSHEGYTFNRLTNYNGHWVKHCGWYPDRKLRLWNRTKGQWGGVNPHDIVLMDHHSNLLHLDGDILHYSYNSISDHLQQTNKFTTISAVALHAQGVRSSLIKITLRPMWQFFRDYFLKAGFLDGFYGLVICSINSMSVFLKYSKLRDLEKNNKIS